MSSATSKQPRVLISVPLTPEWERRLRDTLTDGTLVVTTDKDEIEAALPQTHIWFARLMDKDSLALAANLHWCHVGSTGVNRYPLDLLRAAGIVFTNGRGLQAAAVAEHVLAMLLAWVRRIHHSVRAQTQRKWDRAECLRLDGHSMLVVGMGAIGQELARLASVFGLRTTGIARTPRSLPHTEEVAPPSQLQSLLPHADFVVLACPLTRATHHLIGTKELALMREQAFLVNVGRGALIDETALVAALYAGEIGGAGLDVFETEPLPPSSRLWDMPNVIVTPHTGGSRQNSTNESMALFADNLKRYLAGHPLRNVVDLAHGY